MLKQTQLDVGICWITVTLYIKWNSVHTTWHKHVYIRSITYFTLVALYFKKQWKPIYTKSSWSKIFSNSDENCKGSLWIHVMGLYNARKFYSKKVFQNRAINLSPLHINNPFWGKTKTHSNAFSVLLCVKEYNLVVLDSKLMTW